MANILESMAYIQNQGERGFERGQQTKLASLFGQAYNAPREQRQSLLAQMASVSPQAAYDAEKHFSSMDDMSREEMGRYAMAFDALPDDQKPQAYPAFAMQMQKMGLPAPVQWNPEYAPRIRQFAQAWGGAGATGGMVQSRFVGEDGQIYALMRDGTVSPLGIKADPNTQIMEAAGGIYSINKRNAQAQPVQVGQPAPMQQGPIQYSTSDNQPIPQNKMAAFQAAVQQDARGQDANVPVGGQLPPALNYTGGGQLQAAPPKVSPVQLAQLSLAQQAGARDAERLRLAQEAARQKASMPGATTGGVNAQKLAQANATKMAQFNTAERAIQRLEQAANSIAGNSFFDGGPIDKMVLGKLPQGQELEQAGASLLPVLTALTRVPGVGAQSDLESRLAALQMPSAEFPPEVNKRAVKALREYMRDLKSALQSPTQAAPAAGGSDIDALLDKYK